MGRRRYMYVASERQISIKGSSEGKKLRGEKSTATVLRYAFEGSSSQSIHCRMLNVRKFSPAGGV